MASIPRTDTPGYRQLHERVENALDRLQEAPAIEFKESAPWKTLRWKIIKTALAMGNLRDGGILIVGVSQRASQQPLAGISETDLVTYDRDNIADQFERFSPDIEFTLVQVPYRQNTYLVFEFQEAREIPLECKRAGEGLEVGAVYVRPRGGRPRNTKVTDAAQMRALLELAVEKASGTGDGPPAVTELFDRELEGL